MEAAFLKTAIYKKINIGNHYIGVIDFLAMDHLLEDFARKERFTIYGKLWG